MNDSKSQEMSLISFIKTVKALKILWFISAAFSLITIILNIVTIVSAKKAIDNNSVEAAVGALGAGFFAFIIMIIAIGVGIATFVLQIITLVKIGSIDPKYSNITSGTGKILLIVGFFVIITTIIGAFMLEKEAKLALEELKSE